MEVEAEEITVLADGSVDKYYVAIVFKLFFLGKHVVATLRLRYLKYLYYS